MKICWFRLSERSLHKNFYSLKQETSSASWLLSSENGSRKAQLERKHMRAEWSSSYNSNSPQPLKECHLSCMMARITHANWSQSKWLYQFSWSFCMVSTTKIQRPLDYWAQRKSSLFLLWMSTVSLISKLMRQGMDKYNSNVKMEESLAPASLSRKELTLIETMTSRGTLARPLMTRFADNLIEVRLLSLNQKQDRCVISFFKTETL